MAKYEQQKEVPRFQWNASTGKLFKWLPPESKHRVFILFFDWYERARQRDAAISPPSFDGLSEQERDTLSAMIEDAAQGIQSYWAMCEKNKGNRASAHAEGDQWSTTGRPINERIKEKRIKGMKESNAAPLATVEMVREFAEENSLKDDAERFVEYNNAHGWTYKDGQPLTDWKAYYRVWLLRGDQYNGQIKNPAKDYKQREYNEKEMREILGVHDIYKEE